MEVRFFFERARARARKNPEHCCFEIYAVEGSEEDAKKRTELLERAVKNKKCSYDPIVGAWCISGVIPSTNWDLPLYRGAAEGAHRYLACYKPDGSHYIFAQSY